LVTLAWFLAQDQGWIGLEAIQPVFIGLMSSFLIIFFRTNVSP